MLLEDLDDGVEGTRKLKRGNITMLLSYYERMKSS
jgi:hypothetical protein